MEVFDEHVKLKMTSEKCKIDKNIPFERKVVHPKRRPCQTVDCSHHRQEMTKSRRKRLLGVESQNPNIPTRDRGSWGRGTIVVPPTIHVGSED
jgi:hypothetical protein